MGRLIDEDKMIASLTEHFREINGGFMWMLGAFLVIRAQPTAYDVDKVVQQLTEETVIGADCIGKEFECIPTYKATEIVRGGGVE